MADPRGEYCLNRLAIGLMVLPRAHYRVDPTEVGFDVLDDRGNTRHLKPPAAERPSSLAAARTYDSGKACVSGR
jgi:hypothetical protein